ncbi:hypothetical protein C8N43_3399 [Litoreibacter ponti]|uniref:Uncharacterized protein n=1 Tax=Litoreibacter ponti TaxID=1510457 RepID=A0A2T6BET3_9RHOB|nr:hypothetical protein [Litoreibacter ponti]PTX54582.1 hypothetical protein C8N43_3399 [Litoreibacter ponti]
MTGTAPKIGCGLETLAELSDPKALASLIADAARWPSPAAFHTLPVWFPETARKQPLFKARWSKPMLNKGKEKFQGNTEANRALTQALGTTSKTRANWSCCHIWGNDDQLYQSSRSEVNDRRYFSCLANMVLLPVPLKSFTDTVPGLKAALRIAAHRLYGFMPSGRTRPDLDDAEDWLPDNWRAGEIPGVMPLSALVQKRIRARFATFVADYQESPGHYPKAEVRDVITYWRKRQPKSLFSEVAL